MIGAQVLDRIEQRITHLVQIAPEIEAGTVDALIEDLRLVGSKLALAIARILELIALQLVDPGVALPPLAMACATLAGGARGTLGERELEAARYEIETGDASEFKGKLFIRGVDVDGYRILRTQAPAVPFAPVRPRAGP